jgi:hypothetical protein
MNPATRSLLNLTQDRQRLEGLYFAYSLDALELATQWTFSTGAGSAREEWRPSLGRGRAKRIVESVHRPILRQPSELEVTETLLFGIRNHQCLC